MLDIYSIEYLESSKISEILYNIPISDINFNIKLSENPQIYSSNNKIKILQKKYIDLHQIRNNLNIQEKDLIKTYLNCSFISKFTTKFLLKYNKFINSQFWFLYNKQYSIKLPINSNNLVLQYNNKFNNIDELINNLKNKSIIDYNNTNIINTPYDIVFFSQNEKLNSNKQYNFSVNNNKNILYGNNTFIKKNLYNLRNLIQKRYMTFNAVSNSTDIINTKNRLIISEHVVFQRILNSIMIGYQLLDFNGNMILLFENAVLEISKQLLYFLSSIFEKVELCNEIIRINYSVHFYVICYKFKGFNLNIFNKLIECDKYIDKFNKTLGEKLAFKSNKLNKLHNLDKFVKNQKVIDTHFIINFISYKKNDNIEISINNIVNKNYKLAIEYLKFINTELYLNSKILLYIKKNQKIIANYILKKYFKFNIDIYDINKINNNINNKSIRKIALIHIPRTGLTGLKNQLNKLADKYNSISQRNMVFETKQYIYIITSLYHLVGMDYSSDFTKITIIRNPYERFISTFYYIKEGGKNNPIFPNAEKHTSNLFKKYNINKPIDLFNADTWIKNKILNLNLFKPQYTYICDNYYNKIVEKIYRYENLEKIYNFLNRLLDIKLNIKNKLNYTTTKKILTDKEKDYVYKYYINDFNLLGYSR